MRRVLITGASSGIGKEFAHSFGSRGFDLVLTARSEDALKQLKDELIDEYHIAVDYVCADLLSEEGADSVYRYCKDNDISVAVLVNNAGFGDYGVFMDCDIEKQLKMIDLNCKALIHMTYLFLPDMKEKGYGKILNVGSIASFMPGPYMSVYYATKAFVLSFSLALREELRDHNIGVVTLCPGPTNTSFAKNAEATNAKVFDKLFGRDPQKVAEYGYKLFAENKAYGVEGLLNKTGAFFGRLLPPALAAKAVAYVQSKSRNKEKD